MDTEDSEPTAARKGNSPQGGPLQGEPKISSKLTNLEGAPGEVTEEAIQELFREEKIGTPIDDAEAAAKVDKKDSECQLGKNAGSGAGAPTDEELPYPAPELAHVASPSLHSASLGPSGLKELAGKYGDTVAPVRTESSSLLDTPSLTSGGSDLDRGSSEYGYHAD